MTLAYLGHMLKSGDVISTAEAAKLLGKSIRTVNRLANSGDLRAVKLGDATRPWLFDRDDVEAYKRGAA